MTAGINIGDWLSPAELHNLFEYDAERGVLIWKSRVPEKDKWDKGFNNRFAGQIAGAKLKCGYVYVRISRKNKTRQIFAHLIIHAMVTGEWLSDDLKIDHRDGNGSNNIFENFRVCEQVSNSRNRKINKNNTAGFKGVTRTKTGWRAHIGVNYRLIVIGDNFKNPQEAALAYDVAALKHHGEFAKTNASLGLL